MNTLAEDFILLFNQGYEACGLKGTIVKNPFNRVTDPQFWQEWREGFVACQRVQYAQGAPMRLGARAAHSGMYWYDNPFQEGTPEYDGWLDGWVRVMKDNQGG